MNVVIYARYSSHSQTEQSIEGQLHTCYEYAKNNGYFVVGEYIDRAQSGTTDGRAEFQRMIADSDKHTFEGVLVYQLDRFARNRYDSAINKAKLKKNGVRVISARENISDDASGILVEGVLESMAEYYSAELSQKIRRGMDINAEKCLSNGSNPGLGYYVDEPKTKKGARQIPMSEKVYQALKRAVKNRGKAAPVNIGGYTNFLFLNQSGLPKTASCYESMFQGLVRKYNKHHKPDEALPNITPHTMRHTFCTRLAQAGMNPKDLQYIMGHSNITMTLNYYAHADYASAKAAMDKLAA